MEADVAWMCHPARKGRGSYQQGGKDTARWLARRFEELGYQVRTQEVAGGAVNVFAIKRAGPKVVLVSAHYDHLGVVGDEVFLGADDNASGVAVMLAMARAARTRRHRHTIVFAAFGAEEDGLKGSGAYVQDPLWPLSRTRAVINFDMVGRNFFETGSSKPATAAVVGLELDDGARKVADRRAEEVGLTLVRAPAGLVELFGYAGRTDEWWFRRYGVKAIHFSTGLHPDYHQPSDTPDKLNYQQMERIARTASALVDYFGGRVGP
jgi:Zn-dependent M28 family amino/carboxypeptidase